jgi:hypothetical protein
MTQLEFDVFIAAPVAAVYDYAANPQNWVEWYPGTTKVDGAPAGPPQVGDAWEETVKAAGMGLRFSWRATTVEAPHAWTIDGRAKIQGPLGWLFDGGTATLRYRLDEKQGGTSLHREITFHYSNPLLTLANQLLLRRKIGRELEDGLQHLKRIIEASQGATAPSARRAAS